MFSPSIKTAISSFYKQEVRGGNRVLATESDVTMESTGSLPSVAASEIERSAYGLELQDNLCGALRLDCHIVEGWIAEANAKRLAEKLVIKLAGDPGEYTVLDVDRPDSPYVTQPPDDARYFRADISQFLKSKKRQDYLSISLHEDRSEDARTEVGPLLMFLSVSPEENKPLNQNPELYNQTTVSIANWAIKCNDGLGLRIDEFRQGKSFSTFSQFDPEIVTNGERRVSDGNARYESDSARPTRYSRIAFTEGHTTESTFTLSTDLSVNSGLEEKELEMAILLRADRTTNISARLMRNDKVLSCVGFSAETHWTQVRRQFSGSLSIPRHKTAVYKLEIDVVHRGRGYVDIVACSVSTNPSIQAVIGHEYQGVKTGKSKRRENFIRNGDFSRWSRGFNFDQLQSRQETADAWRIDCRQEKSHSAQVALFQLREQGGDSMKLESSKFGLNARTQSFDGPMRLVSIISREFQNSESIVLKLNIHAPNQDEPIKAMKRIMLMGKSVGSEEVLHVFARNPVVYSNGSFEYTLNEKDLVKIRGLSSKHSNIQICLDLQENTNIVISSVEMYDNSYKADSIKTPTTRPVAVREVSFEDPSIVEQAAFLKGLESWKPGMLTDNLKKEKNPASITSCTGILDLVKPKLVRPAKNYPSLEIIVPIHNALDAVKQCLQSIVEETTVPYTLHCIDDASDSETNEWLKDFCGALQQVQLHTNEDNIGYTRSVNRGLKLSTADWVCVLNSDAIVTSQWLERLVDVAMGYRKIGIVSPLSNAASYQSVPRIHVDDNKDMGWSFNPLPEGVSPNDMAEAVWINSISAHPQVGVSNGFCQLIRREMLDEIGTLDEKSFPRGFGEENDLCARVTKAGWQIRIADDTYVFHIKSQSFGHEQRVALSKQGKMALLKKHPDIDWNEITTDFQNIASLVELRQRLIKQGF